MPFLIFREITRTLTYTIPALGLIWFFITRKNTVAERNPLIPSIRDLYTFAIGFPVMAITSLILSFVMTLFPAPLPPRIEAPNGYAGWIVLVISCMGTGYLEESFFRFYILRKLKNWVSSHGVRIAFSVVLFAVCHAYEGPWGMLNAAVAGFLFATLYERYKSLNGLALAHGTYNIFVYIAAAYL